MNKYLFLLLFALAACTTDKEPQPLSDEVLIAVLADIHIAEAALQRLPRNYKDTVSQRYYDEVAAIHNLSRMELDSSLYWLRARPREMARIYQAVFELLEEQETNIRGLYDPM